MYWFVCVCVCEREREREREEGMEEREIYWDLDSPQLWSQFLAAIYRVLTSFGEVVEIILALTP